MFRELAQILLSIQLSTSHLPAVRADAFAKTMQKQADKVGIDPFILVAIAAHESQFNERAVSQDGMDMGLMQIRCQNYGGNCNWLLEGTNNIRVGADLIRRDIEYCRKKLEREPTTQEWLSVYQGSPSGFRCKPTKLTKLFEDYALCLQDDVENDANRNCREIYYPQLKKAN